MPAETPVTTPPKGVTVATAVELLLHAPGVAVFYSVVVEPAHTASVPVIGGSAALGLTVKLEPLILKKTLPLPFTLILQVVDAVPGLGRVTKDVPVFGNVPIV